MSTRHEVLLASAGTGKTHALSQQLLALLLAGTDPASLLGTTFTRKAAGEIAERLHERLLKALDDDAERAALPAGVDGAPPTREACATLLLRLLRAGDALHVETLDAFFGRLAQAFGAELELPPEWRLVDAAEDERLREQVLSRVLAEGDREELLELLRAWRGAGAEGARATHESLQDDLASTYELWLDAAPDAFDPPAPSALPDAAKLAQLVADFEASPLPVTKSKGTPVANFVKARAKLLAAVADDDWETVATETMSQRALVDGAKFSSAEFTPELRASLRALVHAALQLLEAELARRTRAMGTLLARFHDAYTAAKRSAGALRFDDLPRALERAGTLEPTLLAHRTQARLEHLMLDEFQDTSPLQWRVFEQLAQPMLAARECGSLVVVGDLKQSLYAFRGGDSRLLAGLAERHALSHRELDRNYRSAPALLDFVDAVFTGLPRCGVFDDDPGMATARELWTSRWVPPVAADPDLDGHVRVHRVPCDDANADERRELLAHFAALRIAELRAREPGKQIGVLLRTNKPVAQMLQALRAVGVPAGGAGGAPLTDSSAVRVLLSAVRFAEHPSDGLARLHLELTPLGAALGLAPEPDDAADDALAAALRQSWARLGTAGFVEQLRAAFESRSAPSAWDAVRLGQLVELAERHDELPDLRLADFLRRVETEAVPHPDAQGVQVLTIHASKGLAFDTVVLPELEGASFKREASPLVQRSDPFARIERVWIGGSIKWLELHDELAPRLHEATARSAEGDLCSLYVALTRARTRLELVLPDLERGKPARSYAGLLSEAVDLGEWASDWTPPQREDGDQSALMPGDVDPSVTDASAAYASRPEAPAAHVSAEGDEALADAWLASVAAPGMSAAWTVQASVRRLRGLVWHAWCEHMGWLAADGTPDLDRARADAVALATLVGDGTDAGVLRLDSEWDEFRAALVAPNVRAALVAPEAGSGFVELWREREFQAVDANGRLLSGRFDRVHVTRNADGRAVSAQVLDFKTGRDAADMPGDSTTPAHREQIQRYRDALAAILELPRDAVTGALLYLGDGRVTRVDD